MTAIAPVNRRNAPFNNSLNQEAFMAKQMQAFTPSLDDAAREPLSAVEDLVRLLRAIDSHNEFNRVWNSDRGRSLEFDDVGMSGSIAMIDAGISLESSEARQKTLREYFCRLFLDLQGKEEKGLPARCRGDLRVALLDEIEGSAAGPAVRECSLQPSRQAVHGIWNIDLPMPVRNLGTIRRKRARLSSGSTLQTLMDRLVKANQSGCTCYYLFERNSIRLFEEEKPLLTHFGSPSMAPVVRHEVTSIKTFSPLWIADESFFAFRIEWGLAGPTAARNTLSDYSMRPVTDPGMRHEGNRIEVFYDPIDRSHRADERLMKDLGFYTKSGATAAPPSTSDCWMLEPWLSGPCCVGAYPPTTSSGNTSRYHQLERFVLRSKTEELYGVDSYRRRFWSFGKRLDALDLRRRGPGGTAPNCLAFIDSIYRPKTKERSSPVKRTAKPDASRTTAVRPQIAFDLRFFHLSKSYVPIAFREKPPPLPWASSLHPISPHPISPLHVTVRG